MVAFLYLQSGVRPQGTPSSGMQSQGWDGMGWWRTTAEPYLVPESTNEL